LSPDHGETDLARTAEAFVRRHQRRGPLVLVSDLYDRRGFERPLDVLRHHGYEVRIVHIYDPREAEVRHLGDVELWDVESGRGREVTITERAAARYCMLFTGFLASVRDYCWRSAVKCLQVACDEPRDAVLLSVLRGVPAKRAG